MLDPFDLFSFVHRADTKSLSQKKSAYRYIALTLQKQYENQLRSSNGVGPIVPTHTQIRTKHLLDPSLGNVETACEEIRASGDKASQNRVIFHYNGHGVPIPSDLGEIWVFNKRYDKYKPLPISLIHVVAVSLSDRRAGSRRPRST